MIWFVSLNTSLLFIACSGIFADKEDAEHVGISMHAIDLAAGVDYAVGAVTNSGFEKIVELNPRNQDYVILGKSFLQK